MCQRQAVKLQNLQLRLEDSAAVEQKPVFIVINEDHPWSKNQFDHLRNLAGRKVITIQGNGRDWASVKGRKDDILIIDKCGRVTFHLSLPWSQLHLAYVKAAILATSKDQPCGSCSQGSELGIKAAPADTVSVDDVLPILQTLTNVTETNSNEIDTDEREQRKQRQLNWMRPYLGFSL
ncbi:selenoprotein P-like [Cloeon dipterum]|uniref:selenoprotein P-like n=1 Tax=Cloeon dipterum TaxID=197152 RepID=UPI00322004AF